MADRIKADRYQRFSIELDCPPGGIRPDDLIEGILKGMGLEVLDFEDSGVPFFGAKNWILKEKSGKDELYTEKKPEIKRRVVQLYNDGYIRYGSW